VHRAAQPGGRVVDPGPQRGRRFPDRRVCGGLGQLPGLEREQHQIHLQPVVQILGDPAPLPVRGLDQPDPGPAQLLLAGAQLGGQSLRLHRQANHPARRQDLVGVSDQHRIVNGLFRIQSARAPQCSRDLIR
jgi:hypothetical protein